MLEKTTFQEREKDEASKPLFRHIPRCNRYLSRRWGSLGDVLALLQILVISGNWTASIVRPLVQYALSIGQIHQEWEISEDMVNARTLLLTELGKGNDDDIQKKNMCQF